MTVKITVTSRNGHIDTSREVTEDRLKELISLYFQMYLIPANELDRRSQAMSIRLGMPVKDLDEIRQEMGDSWADLLIKHIHTGLNS
jgi:hypothetical protein